MSEEQMIMDPVSISGAPAEGQKVEHEGKIYTTIKEGLAYILVPADSVLSSDAKKVKNGLIESQSVFYNPIQQFNRDLTVLAIRAYGDDLMALKQARTEAKIKKQNRGRQENRGVKRKANGEELPGSKTLENTYISATHQAPSNEVDIVPETMPQETISNPIVVGNDRVITEATATEKSNVNGNVIDHDNSTTLEQTVAEETVKPQHTDSDKTEQKGSQNFKPKFRILDALSATGLRALRYAHEIPYASFITANDLSAQAVASIKLNVEHNKLNKKIKAIAGNALAHMYSFVTQPIDGSAKQEGRYDTIDLDPYGTAAPFLDAAVQALNDGGLLCVTCTDAGVWASCGYPEKAYSLYGGTPMKGLHSHEGGLRLILHAIASSAARYGMSIEPLLSLSIDFYARIFVRVHRSPAEVKLLAGKTMLVYCCDHGCGAWQTQFLGRNQVVMGKDGKTPFTKHGLAQGPTSNMFCEHCGFKQHLSGPMYGGPLHNPAFIQTILNYLPELDKSTYGTTARIEGMLSTALEETVLEDDSEIVAGDANTKAEAQAKRPVPRADASKVDDHPFFFIPTALAKIVHTSAPGEAAIKGALRHAGYRATRSHCKPGAIRTDAPWTFIWEMMREWVRQRAPVKKEAFKKGTAGWEIMGKELAKAEGNFEEDGGVKVPPLKKDAGDNASVLEGENMDVDKPLEEEDAPAKRQIVFDEKLGREVNQKRLVRFQTNPRANWGPMNRAKVKAKQNNDEETA